MFMGKLEFWLSEKKFPTDLVYRMFSKISWVLQRNLEFPHR